MSISISQLIVQAETAMGPLGHAPSTRMQYWWAWSQFARFCSRDAVEEFSEEAVDAFIEFVAAEHRAGRYKEWKRRLLRKAALVLSEVARTGSYEWRLSRQTHPNDALNVVFRPVQEQFEQWLQGQSLAVMTQNLYATVSRTALAWLPERGVADVRALSRIDVSAMVVFLGSRYQPGSMRTVVSALRVLCRFWEESGYGAGLSQAVPAQMVRRVRSVGVVSADGIDALVNSVVVSTPMGLRDRALLILGARTGLRPVDIAGLRLRDIDWPHACRPARYLTMSASSLVTMPGHEKAPPVDSGRAFIGAVTWRSSLVTRAHSLFSVIADCAAARSTIALSAA
ncbi:hypothetical protein QMG61_15605 [Cryobacterium sp. PH31-AA6]|uniref:hypothetical protein n=1 Tax=Cryobacterium sp. PH31-AA6 TaxID=3046205 RepID=UPI0024BB5530|nr:hypothetical protein [Cryobacterium sp. PH31-AA6]MDJ0325191.1 hypothetical protein [Cryobacterium sp. PH31-AA6]